MIAEQWRPVPGMPSCMVSNTGRVVSTRRGQPRELRGWIGGTGYRLVDLRPDLSVERVHRLVAEAFYGPCPEGQEVRHLDGDRLNNVLDNLRFGTRSENVRDAVDHGTHSETRKTHCPKGHPYDAANTYVAPSGRARVCRTCARVNSRARTARSSAANVQECAA